MSPRKIVESLPGFGFPQIVGTGVPDATLKHSFTFFLSIGDLRPPFFGHPVAFEGETTETLSIRDELGNPVTVNLDTSINIGWGGWNQFAAEFAFYGGQGGCILSFRDDDDSWDGQEHSPWWEFEDSGTVRLSRFVSSNITGTGPSPPSTIVDALDVTMPGQIIEWNSIPVRQQSGTLDMSSSALASKTLDFPVEQGRTFVNFRGTEVRQPASNQAQHYVKLFLDDLSGNRYRELTAQRFVGGPQVVVHYDVVEFLAGPRCNFQQIDTEFSGTSTTDTIEEVDITKAFIIKQGPGMIHSTAVPLNQGASSSFVQLTNGTTVTTQKAISGTTISLSYNVLEFP